MDPLIHTGAQAPEKAAFQMNESPPSPRASKASKRIRVGLIGVGNWANHGHLRVLELLPEYEVVAVHARRREAAEAAAARFAIPNVVDSAEALIAHPDVDLVA